MRVRTGAVSRVKGRQQGGIARHSHVHSPHMQWHKAAGAQVSVCRRHCRIHVHSQHTHMCARAPGASFRGTLVFGKDRLGILLGVGCANLEALRVAARPVGERTLMATEVRPSSGGFLFAILLTQPSRMVIIPPARAQLWPNLSRPSVDPSEFRPIAVRFSPPFEFGRTWTKHLPNSGPLWPNLAKHRPTSVVDGPKPIEVRPALVKFGGSREGWAR